MKTGFRYKIIIIIIILLCFNIIITPTNNNTTINNETQIYYSEIFHNNSKPLMHKSGSKEIMPPKYISHAGGQINGHILTNCKEALEQSRAKGYRFIEVDISWTEDNRPVLLHSWDGLVTKFFGVERQQYTLNEFKQFNMMEGYTQMTLEDLVSWMVENEEMYIITDVKEKNTELLKLINDEYSEIMKRVIPQIYIVEEYNIAKSLGYEHIIFTLYKVKASDDWCTKDEFIDFIKSNNFFAVTMPEYRVGQGIAKRLYKEGILVYCHTINSKEKYEELKELGVYGIYTDILIE